MTDTADTSKAGNIVEVTFTDSGADWNHSTDGGFADTMHIKSIIWHPSAASDVLTITEGGVDGPSIVHWKAYADAITDGGMEAWTTATNLTNWTESISGTSTVNQEATTIHGGTYSCHLEVDASNSNVRIQQNFSIIPLKKYKVVFWYKNSVAGKTARVKTFDTGSNVWLTPTGSWQTEDTATTLANSITWKKFGLEFYAHADYSDYTIQLRNLTAHSSSIYLDDVSIVELPINKQIDFGEKGVPLKPYIDISDCDFDDITATKIIFILE